MIHIAICDDELAFRDKITACLQRYTDARPNLQGRVCVHACGTLQQLSALTEIDLLLLDIGFGDKTCLPLAQKLRRRFPSMLLIFITSMAEYMPEGYELNAFRYLLKSQLDRCFDRYMDAAFARLYPVWQVEYNGGRHSIDIAKIVCIEVQKRVLTVRLQPHRELPQTVSFYGSMQSAEKEPGLHDFLRPHRSFLINPAHIVSLQKTEVTMTGEIHVPVSRVNAETVKQQWLAWEMRQSWNI